MRVDEYREAYTLIGHPDKLKVLLYLYRNQRISPSMFYQKTSHGPSLNLVAHQFRSLKKSGLIEEVDYARRRGAIEHFYSLTQKGVDLAQLFVPV